MRLLIAILVIAVVAGLATYIFPWWTAAIVAFVVAMAFRLNAGKAFCAGFFGVAFLWLAVALVKDNANEHILSGRMAELFQLPSYILYIVVASVIGGLVGGLAGWSGAAVRRNLFREKQVGSA